MSTYPDGSAKVAQDPKILEAALNRLWNYGNDRVSLLQRLQACVDRLKSSTPEVSPGSPDATPEPDSIVSRLDATAWKADKNNEWLAGLVLRLEELV